MSERIAEKCLLRYMQSWGQSVQDRIDALNETVAAAGIQARFGQGPNGENAGWRGADTERAIEFRKRLDDCWRGSFEDEVAAINALIAEFRNNPHVALSHT